VIGADAVHGQRKSVHRKSVGDRAPCLKGKRRKNGGGLRKAGIIAIAERGNASGTMILRSLVKFQFGGFYKIGSVIQSTLAKRLRAKRRASPKRVGRGGPFFRA